MRTLAAVAGASLLLLAGCATGGESAGSVTSGGSASSSATRHREHDAMPMDMGSSVHRPTSTASMICGDEIRGVVRRTFTLQEQPRPSTTWDRRTRLFRCVYRLPAGELRMSVQDAVDQRRGRAHFDRVRAGADQPRPIRGMENLGFPAFDTAAGQVVFVKDGKTLTVDATRLAASRLPEGYDRADAAYAVASAVIACWTE